MIKIKHVGRIIADDEDCMQRFLSQLRNCGYFMKRNDCLDSSERICDIFVEVTIPAEKGERRMTSEEASKQIAEILEYFEDRIERETDPAFDKEIAQKDADALRMAINVMSSPKDVYVVTQNGYLDGYGSEIYLVGVFTEKKKAEKAAPAERANITEIQLDKAFPLEKSNWGSVGNDYYLGGYVE